MAAIEFNGAVCTSARPPPPFPFLAQGMTMQTNQLSQMIAGVVLCGVLWSGGALAGGAKAGSDCPRPTPGVSLCGKVDTALSTCVQERTCEKKSGNKKRGKGGLGFLSRLFI